MTTESSSYDLVSLDAPEHTQKPIVVGQNKYIQKRLEGRNQVTAQPILSVTRDLSVVIPTRNEQDNIRPLLEALQDSLHDLDVELIFVEDSDDDPPAIIKDASRTMDSSLFHIRLEHRLPGSARTGGLATAVVYGMGKAQAHYVAVIDADLQHPPEQLRVFYDQAIAQDIDLVLASRYIEGGSYLGLADAGRRFYSVGLKWIAKVLFPEQLRRISDPLGGFFLLRRSLLTGVSLRPIGYKILLELLLRCQWRDALEVPYHFQARVHGQSKANMKQGIMVLQHMLRLFCEVPSAGRLWKTSAVLLMNIAAILILFTLHTHFSSTWAHLKLIVLAAIACLDFVIFKPFIFPSKRSLQV